MAPERSPENTSKTTQYFIQLMNERLKYEQLISGKLESLPVPDMQDQIWARVKAQLDIDLPTDDGDGGSNPQSPSGPGIIGWGLSILIIALVTTFFIYKNNQRTKDNTDRSTTTEQTIQPSEQATDPPVQDDEGIKKTTPVNTGSNISIPVGTKDSVAQQDLGAVIPDTKDSVQKKIPEQALSFSPSKTDTIPPKKKGKGLSGLKDNDYRIVPKKDN